MDENEEENKVREEKKKITVKLTQKKETITKRKCDAQSEVKNEMGHSEWGRKTKEMCRARWEGNVQSEVEKESCIKWGGKRKAMYKVR